MSEKLAEENKMRTFSEESSKKVDSNQDGEEKHSQDASKWKSNEEGSIRSNVPGESVIGNQEPNEVLNKSQQEKPEEQIESSLILNTGRVENLNEEQQIGAGNGEEGGNNSDDEESDDKSEQD